MTGSDFIAGKKNTVLKVERKEGEEKQEAIKNAIAQLEKDFGKGVFMKMGERTGMDVEAVTTGSIGLDHALGVGGIPTGRIIEVFGPESSGKTTLALHMVAEVQKHEGIAAFIDAEHALDPVYAKKIGVNIDDLYVSQPDSGDQAMEIAEMLVRSGAVSLVVVDSVAALVPRQEIEGSMGDSHVGLQARLMSQALRKLSPVASKYNCTLVFLNQLREKVGAYGNPEVTSGGRALKFYASVRLDVRKVEQVKSDGETIGSHVRVRVVKNKVAPPFKETEFDILYGKGIDRTGELLDMAVSAGLVSKSGSWYAYNGEKIGQGSDNARNYLEADNEMRKELEKALGSRFPLQDGHRQSAQDMCECM